MLPSKVIPLTDNVLLKLPAILDKLAHSAMSISELYQSAKNTFRDINEFIYALDVLFVLNAIQVTACGEVRINVEIYTM